MTDLIERLRSSAIVCYALLKGAADEIERLREELAKAQKGEKERRKALSWFADVHIGIRKPKYVLKAIDKAMEES